MSYQWDKEKFVKFMNYKNLKNVTAFASGENLVIAQINNELLASTNVKLSPSYAISRNFSKNIIRFVVTGSSDQYVTCFYKSSDSGLRMTTMRSELEEVHGKTGLCCEMPENRYIDTNIFLLRIISR